MSIYIRDCDYYDFSDIDIIRCVGNHSEKIIATLVINDYQKFPLCSECLESILEDVQRIKNGVYCYNCEYFKFSNSGWDYDGHCTLHNRDRAPSESCKDGVSIERGNKQ